MKLIIMMLQKYSKPLIKKIVLLTKSDILSGSIVEANTEITIMGQEVIDFDFSDTEFNWEWEKNKN